MPLLERPLSETTDSRAGTVARREGMGAIPHSTGTAFRVWAPNAQRVSVVGSFNHWDAFASPLESEGNGYWYGDVHGARPGDEYRFHIVNGTMELSRVDPYARETTNSAGNGVIAGLEFDWEGDAFHLAPLNELAIYELHIGTFGRSPGQDRPASFEDAAKELDHLVALGINAVEIMPIAEFAGDRSWGYNPAHIFAVESAYGGPKAFKTFVKEAHRRGIGVVLDVVYNHFGPGDLDLWQFDGWSENGGGGIYFYNDWRSKTPWGDTRPDYGRPEVRQIIRDNAVMWLDEFHVDGLRMDGTLFIRNAEGQSNKPETDLKEGWSLMQWLTGEVRARRKLAIAEDLQDNDWLTKPAEEGGAGFHAQWCAQFVHPVRAVANELDDERRSMERLLGAIAHRFNGDPFQRVIYSESHDEVANGRSRVPQEIDPQDPDGYFAQKRSTLAAGLVFTAPGVPMIFQGQELLADGFFEDTRPIDWERLDEYRGIAHLYRDLIHLRLNRRGTTRGLTGASIRLALVDEVAKALVFQRSHSGGPGDDTMVALNFSHRDLTGVPIPFPAPGRWVCRLNSAWSGYSPLFGGVAGDVEAQPGSFDDYPAHGAVDLPAYTLLVFSQDSN
jgi:1,4-alpha-glucan branching enzyme